MRKTGLKDCNGRDIFEGEIILSGMREGDSSGWTSERVINLRTGWRKWILKPVWALADPIHGEIMDMQNNPRLRRKL